MIQFNELDIEIQIDDVEGLNSIVMDKNNKSNYYWSIVPGETMERLITLSLPHRKVLENTETSKIRQKLMMLVSIVDYLIIGMKMKILDAAIVGNRLHNGEFYKLSQLPKEIKRDDYASSVITAYLKTQYLQ